ncbi:tRNA(fMet)-specific endonuclease VapC [subsurface metagenome]
MEYLIDTNIVIYFLKGKYGIRDKIREVGLDKCAISEITLAELYYGAEKSDYPDNNIKVINDFIDDITVLPIFNSIQIFGKEKARLRKVGKIISDFDLLIGTTAIAYDLTMVTRNTSEFERLEGINLLDWTKE